MYLIMRASERIGQGTNAEEPATLKIGNEIEPASIAQCVYVCMIDGECTCAEVVLDSSDH